MRGSSLTLAATAIALAVLLFAPLIQEPVSTVTDAGAEVDGAARPPAPAWGVGVRDAAELADARAAGFDPGIVGAFHWFTRWQSPSDVAWTAERAADLTRAAPGAPVLVHYWWWAEESTYRCMALEACGLTRAEWFARSALVGAELARALPADARVVIVLETEVNDARLFEDAGSGWVESGFVDAMAEAARRLRAPLGDRGAVVLSLGAYGFANYPRLEPLLERAEFSAVGFQAHATGDPNAPCGGDEDYVRAFQERALRAARTLAPLTVKPLGLWDAFVASDGKTGETDQATWYAALAGHARELDDLGVRWVVARALTDWPDAPRGCLGEGEKHLGFRTADGRWKPAWAAWLAGASPASGTRHA